MRLDSVIFFLLNDHTKCFIEARSAHFARPIKAHGTSGCKKREKGLIKETNNDHVIEHRFRTNAKTI